MNDADELPADLAGTVGVTAGASAPQELVDRVLARLAPAAGTEEVHVTDEDEYFPPPRNIRDLQTAVGRAIESLSGADPVRSRPLEDRSLAASTVLEALSLA